MNDLEQHVLEAIMARPGQQAKHIAAQLGFDRKLVNSALYGSLRSKVQQDKSYLDCLRHDDIGGVSEFTASKYGGPNYVEIQALPVSNGDAGDPFDTEAGRKLLGRLRRDRYQKTVFLGYPVRLSLIRGRRGWEGFVVQPLLLFPFQEADSRCGNPTLVDVPAPTQLSGAPGIVQRRRHRSDGGGDPIGGRAGAEQCRR